MNKLIRLIPLIIVSVILLVACKKPAPALLDFSKLTETNSKCELAGTIDSNAWKNDVLNLKNDTLLLTFSDNIYLSDSIPGTIQISAPCPNPSNGFFFWSVNASRACKLKLVCINDSSDILYYNSYRLQNGPVDIGFNFRSNTSFHKNNNFRMYYAFYTSKDSIFYAGYGNFRIE